jgi:hypothetical protein
VQGRSVSINERHHKQQSHLDPQVNTIRKDHGYRNYFPGHRNPLDQARVVDNRGGRAGPGSREEIVRDQAAQDEQGVVHLPGPAEDVAEHKRENCHHDQGVDEGPQHSQGHIPVADAEILQNEVFEEEEEVPVPPGPVPEASWKFQVYNATWREAQNRGNSPPKRTWG